MTIRRAAALALLCSAALACSKPAVFIRPGYDFRRIKRIALLSFKDNPKLKGSGEMASDTFEKYLIQANYDVIERRQAELLLKEQALNLSGAIDRETTKDIGRILGVDAVILGDLIDLVAQKSERVVTNVKDETREPIIKRRYEKEKVGDEWVTVEKEVITGYRTTKNVHQVPQELTIDAQASVAARMVDVQNASVLWSGSATAYGSTIEDAIDNAARKIVSGTKKIWPVVER